MRCFYLWAFVLEEAVSLHLGGPELLDEGLHQQDDVRTFQTGYAADDYIEDTIPEDTDFAVGQNRSEKTVTPEDDIRGGGPPDWCPRSKYLVPSPEDKFMGQKKCSDDHVLTHRGEHGLPCRYHDLYGRFIRGRGNATFYYVEVPKTASSTIKNMINPFCQTGPNQKIGSGSECGVPHVPSVTTAFAVRGIKAFSFVRHPILRFLSGYGTVVARGHEWHDQDLVNILHLPEPQRFKRFVVKFLSLGPLILKNRGVVFTHLMSQTFFLDLWPGKIHFVGHTENFEWSVMQLGVFLGVKIAAPKHLTEAEGSLNRTMMFSCSLEMQLLHNHFREEIYRYGYKPLPGFH